MQSSQLINASELQAMKGSQETSAPVSSPNLERSESPLEWSTGLCGCLHDAGICVWGFCCLPCQFGENVGQLYRTPQEDGECFLACCLYSACFPCYPCLGGLVRRDLRHKYNLKHEPCGDCFVHLCCTPCAICQEARELKV